MKGCNTAVGPFVLLLIFGAIPCTVTSQENSTTGTVEVHAVITDQAQREDSETPPLQPGDVKVRQNKGPVRVTQLIPARGENDALQLFILIDDTVDSRVGNNLNDVRDFINAQPPSTVVGIGYMSNATVNIVQNFTADHAAAVKAVRLPLGRFSTMDSPYLSLMSLVKGWTLQKVRREVLMVTDGIDRLRGEQPGRSRLGTGFGPAYHSMPTMSPDVNSASEISQRYNVIVYSIYTPGVGRAARSYWDQQIGLSGMSKISEETGGDVFSLGTSNPVSFKPYLGRLQNYLANQYYVVFQANAGKKPGLQRVTFKTEVPNAEIVAPDNVWVGSGK